MDISLIMHDQHLKLDICVDNIAVEGTESKIFDKGPSSFSIKASIEATWVIGHQHR